MTINYSVKIGVKGILITMKTSYKITTYLIIATGVIHSSMTPVFFDEFTIRTMWFFGVGLMGIFLGFLNIAHWRTAGNDSVVRRLCISANSVTVIYGVTNLFVDKDPQGYLIIALFVYLTFASFVVGRES